MQLSAKWRNGWSVYSQGSPDARIRAYGIGGETVEVVRLGRGEPIVVIPGLAGGWKFVWPLVRSLGRHFEVIAVGLRGDDGAVG